ncbi:hypothetical protein F2Q69_00054234 [Brassica cretica]|uniref:Uncharacterized protein n=1 Tax=Brassica cretica TaxID=69181 RepID=A0A8S9N353_BRACR|nr:hypothetical protein F2Q69_00054234 [Brassica cretica]
MRRSALDCLSPNCEIFRDLRLFTTAEKGKQKESEQLPADTPAVERNTKPVVGTSSPGPEQPAEAVRPSQRKMLEDLTVRLPLMDEIQMMPSMRNFMKGLISGKISEESEFMTVSKECSAKESEQLPAETPAVERNTEPAVGTSSPGPENQLKLFAQSQRLFLLANTFLKSLTLFQQRPLILTKDPLELALVRAEAEQSVVNIDADGYAKMLDSARTDTPAVERNTEPAVGTSSPGPEQPAEAVRPIPEVVPPREYIPKVPYPVPAKATLRAEAEQSVVNIDADGYAKILDSARTEAKQSVVNIDADGYAKMLDSTRSMGKMEKESEQLPADTPADEKNIEPAVGTSSPGPEQPAEAVRPIPEVVPPREYIPKVPYRVPAKATQDPLELALLRAEAEQSVVNIDADGYAKMLDSARSMGRMTGMPRCLIPEGVWEEW